jgi:uncharacterized protein
MATLWRNRYNAFCQGRFADADRSARAETPGRCHWRGDNGRQDRDRRDNRETQTAIGEGPIREGRGEGARGVDDGRGAVGSREAGSRDKVEVMALDRDKWALIILSLADDGELTPVQVQKALFVLCQEAGDAVGKNFYKFEPYNYGPFDKDIYVDLENFSKDGLVEMEKVDGRKWTNYKITDAGRRMAKEVSSSSDEEIIEYAKNVVDWTKSLSFARLVGAIYKKYPDYAVNSVFNK